VSTADDLNRFYAGLLSGALLGPAELKQLLTITDNEHYGLGIERVLLPSGLVLWGHSAEFSVTSPAATTPPMPAAR
jgi:D-alanyl-D-alanine carboxypeptidase